MTLKHWFAYRIMTAKQRLRSQNPFFAFFTYVRIGVFEILLGISTMHMYVVRTHRHDPTVFNEEGFSYTLYARRRRISLFIVTFLFIGGWVYTTSVTLIALPHSEDSFTSFDPYTANIPANIAASTTMPSTLAVSWDANRNQPGTEYFVAISSGQDTQHSNWITDTHHLFTVAEGRDYVITVKARSLEFTETKAIAARVSIARKVEDTPEPPPVVVKVAPKPPPPKPAVQPVIANPVAAIGNIITRIVQKEEPKKEDISIKNGDLVRLSRDPNIYFVEAGKRRLIPSNRMFRLLGFKLRNIRVVSAEMLGEVPIGTTFSMADVGPYFVNLAFPQQHTDVRALKEYLHPEYYPLRDRSIDFSSNLEIGLRRFQKDNKIPQTGKLDEKTREVLNGLING